MGKGKRVISNAAHGELIPLPEITPDVQHVSYAVATTAIPSNA